MVLNILSYLIILFVICSSVSLLYLSRLVKYDYKSKLMEIYILVHYFVLLGLPLFCQMFMIYCRICQPFATIGFKIAIFGACPF